MFHKKLLMDPIYPCHILLPLQFCFLKQYKCTCLVTSYGHEVTIFLKTWYILCSELYNFLLDKTVWNQQINHAYKFLHPWFFRGGPKTYVLFFTHIQSDMFIESFPACLFKSTPTYDRRRRVLRCFTCCTMPKVAPYIILKTILL